MTDFKHRFKHNNPLLELIDLLIADYPDSAEHFTLEKLNFGPAVKITPAESNGWKNTSVLVKATSESALIGTTTLYYNRISLNTYFDQETKTVQNRNVGVHAHGITAPAKFGEAYFYFNYANATAEEFAQIREAMPYPNAIYSELPVHNPEGYNVDFNGFGYSANDSTAVSSVHPKSYRFVPDESITVYAKMTAPSVASAFPKRSVKPFHFISGALKNRYHEHPTSGGLASYCKFDRYTPEEASLGKLDAAVCMYGLDLTSAISDTNTIEHFGRIDEATLTPLNRLLDYQNIPAVDSKFIGRGIDTYGSASGVGSYWPYALKDGVGGALNTLAIFTQTTVNGEGNVPGSTVAGDDKFVFIWDSLPSHYSNAYYMGKNVINIPFIKFT